jgi:protein STE50
MRRQPSFKWAQYVKPAKSPTKPDIVESPQPSPQQPEHNIPYNRNTPQPQFQTTSISSDRPRVQVLPSQDSPGSTQGQLSAQSKSSRQDSNDNLKSFKVSLDDPTWKVLPAALKKYRINNDNWQNYAMFICYGSTGMYSPLNFLGLITDDMRITGNRIERCLSYDEKPLLLFQKLKDAKKNPVFMLKHIKDIRSPIAVAQQKHAARKASSADGHSSSMANGKLSAGSGSGRSTSRPPKLEVNDLSQPIMTGVNPQPGWPEIMSPTIEQKEQDLGSAGNSSAGGMNGSSEKSRNAGGSGDSGEGGTGPVVREIPVPIAGVSYAVAIYPYMAEQDDEFDVIV